MNFLEFFINYLDLYISENIFTNKYLYSLF